MMRSYFSFSMAAAAVILSVFFTACPNLALGGNEGAGLKSITIAGRKVTLGKPASTMGKVTPAFFYLSYEEASAEVTVKIKANSDKTKVEYGKIISGGGSPEWKNSSTMKFNYGDLLVVKTSGARGTVYYYQVEILIDAKLLGKVVILQAYGTGANNDGGVSHSFIELFNKSSEEVDLTGHSLQYSEGGTDWKVLNLNNKKIPAGHSFLILGQKMNDRSDAAGTGLLQLEPARADMQWQSGQELLQMYNKRFKILLIENTAPAAVVNPFDISGNKTGKKIRGYVDLLGTNDNDKENNIDAFETGNLKDSNISGPYLLSKGKSVRRVDLNDTDDNNRDFEEVEWFRNSGKAISAEDFEALRPRSVQDGAWDPVYSRSPTGNANANIGTLRIAGVIANPGSPASSYSAVTSPGSVSLTHLVASSAPVELTLAVGAAFRTAKTSGNAAPQWSNFPAPAYFFSSGDFLYIEVTSQNGKTVNVYKISVTVTPVSSTVNVGGNYTLILNSPIPPQRVAIEAYTTQAATQLVSRAEANMQTKAWSLDVPAGQAVWFKMAVTDETGYTFGKVVSTSSLSFANSTGGIDLALGPFALPELKTFILLDATVSGGAKGAKTGIINHELDTVTFPSTNFNTVNAHTIINFHELIATFTLSDDSKLYAGNIEQVSGITTNNYYEDVYLTVVAGDNTRKVYVIDGYAPGATSVIGTTNFQTQGFGVLNITTTNKTLGMPIRENASGGASHVTKLNMVWNPTGIFTYISPEGRVVKGGTSIKGRGNYSVRHNSRKSYTLKLNSSAGFDYYDYKTKRFITLPEHKRWSLLAHEADNTRIRSPLGFEMGRRVLTNMGWQPHADWVFFFLNGEYLGVYILTEERKIDEGRLDILPAASLANPDGGFIVEFNNMFWYHNDIINKNPGREFIFDELYNFMTSHLNPVNNRSGHDGGTGQLKQQGVVWSFKDPDTNLGWYYPDPPEGDGTLTYEDTTHFPRKGIALYAQLSNGSEYNRASKYPGEWIVPDDFEEPNGMGTLRMLQQGTLGGNNGGIYGSRTLDEVYPNWNSSVFVKMASFIQDAEDAIYAHDWGVNGVGGYHDYIDIDAFIDWHIAKEMCANWEIIALNGQFMYYDPAVQKLKMGIIWDLDQGWSSGTNMASPGFVGKTPFWYKELLGWELTTTSANDPLRGSAKQDKDTYYINRLKDRWAEVRGQFSMELDAYIDEQNARFTRISAYPSPVSINGSRTALKTTISTMVTRLNTTFNGY